MSGTLFLTRKERSVLLYLCKVCPKKRTCLISPSDVSAALSKKFVLSIAELDEIMTVLSDENYIEFVVSESKMGYYYCVTLKKKGQTFVIDSKSRRRNFGLLVLRSLFLATVSFIFGLVLKTIFKG